MDDTSATLEVLYSIESAVIGQTETMTGLLCVLIGAVCLCVSMLTWICTWPLRGKV